MSIKAMKCHMLLLRESRNDQDMVFALQELSTERENRQDGT
jgi:hypothetical protein